MSAMRPPRPRFEDRITDWQRAFWIMEEELNGHVIDFTREERIANRRTAAVAAAILMAGGNRPAGSVPPMEDDRG